MIKAVKSNALNMDNRVNKPFNESTPNSAKSALFWAGGGLDIIGLEGIGGA